MERWSEATASFDSALTRDPTCSEAQFCRAHVLMRQHQYEEALASFERLIELDMTSAEVHLGRARALCELERWGDALSGYNRAIAERADCAEAFLGRARALEHLEGLDAALAGYERVLKLKPDWDQAHTQRGFGLLARGRLEAGFSDYEWRAAAKEDTLGARTPPRWTSRAEPIGGKRILLRAEQGLGDTLHFCRYATLVASLGAEVILSVPAPLKALLTGLKGVSRVLAFNDELPEFDTHCKLMSLPYSPGDFFGDGSE